MQTFKSKSTGEVYAYEPDVVISTDANAVTTGSIDGRVLNVPPDLVPYTPPSPVVPSLAELQASQIAIINSACQESLLQLVAAYPEMEISTWPQQYREAQAFQLSTTASTPTLSAIATASGSTVAKLAASVVSKAAAYQGSSGAFVGKRQALTKQIEAVTDKNPTNPSAATIASIQAIVW